MMNADGGVCDADTGGRGEELDGVVSDMGEGMGACRGVVWISRESVYVVLFSTVYENCEISYIHVNVKWMGSKMFGQNY